MNASITGPVFVLKGEYPDRESAREAVACWKRIGFDSYCSPANEGFVVHVENKRSLNNFLTQAEAVELFGAEVLNCSDLESFFVGKRDCQFYRVRRVEQFFKVRSVRVFDKQKSPSPWRASGFSRKHYKDEHERHQEFYDVRYALPSDATPIVRKLCRHFKLMVSVSYSTRGGGRAMINGLGFQDGELKAKFHVKLPRENISLGLICHELAHCRDRKVNGKMNHHNRKYQRQSNIVCNWAKRYLPKKEETKCSDTLLQESFCSQA